MVSRVVVEEVMGEHELPKRSMAARLGLWAFDVVCARLWFIPAVRRLWAWQTGSLYQG